MILLLFLFLGAWLLCGALVSFAGVPSEPAMIIGLFLLIGIIAVVCMVNSSKSNPPAPQNTATPPSNTRHTYDFGEYREAISSGGELVVKLFGWSIQYSFPGPDRRYNWTFIEVEDLEIEEYIHAWKENYAEYRALKDRIPSGSKFSKNGLAGMTIRCGIYPQGVCLRGYNMPVCTDERLAEIISDYENADSRAQKIVRILSNPDSKEKL